jgi:tetratricopeptide (TPR) repeat protein
MRRTNRKRQSSSTRRVLRQRPNEFDALHMLGLIEYQRGRLPESLKLIGAAVKSNPNSADAWSNLGLAFHAQGDYAKAVGSFDRALAIKPDHADVLNNRGTTLNCLGRHEEALEAFARALALRSDYLFRALQPRLDAAQSRTLCRGACKLRDRAGNRAEPSRYVMSSRYVIAAMRC